MYFDIVLFILATKEGARRYMRIIRRKDTIIGGDQISNFDLVYVLEKDGQEVEIGRIPWNNLWSLLGAENDYERGLVAAAKAFGVKEFDLV